MIAICQIVIIKIKGWLAKQSTTATKNNNGRKQTLYYYTKPGKTSF